MCEGVCVGVYVWVCEGVCEGVCVGVVVSVGVGVHDVCLGVGWWVCECGVGGYMWLWVFMGEQPSPQAFFFSFLIPFFYSF